MNTLPRTRRLAVACLALVAAPFVSMGVAHAQNVSLVDGRGDMWRLDESQSTETLTAAPQHVNGDVRRVTVRHRTHALLVRARFVDLRRSGEAVGLGGDIRTNEGLRRSFSVFGVRHHWRALVELDRRNGDAVDCAITSSIDYAVDVIEVRIPRSCLDDPRWVQLQIGGIHIAGGDVGGFYIDDAQTDRANTKSWTPRLRVG